MTYKNGTNKFTLSQKIVLLITFVIVASLLPASLLIAHRVSGVVDERISVNAVSITTLLSHSPAVIRSLTYETDINNTNETLNNVVNMAAKSCKASIIILDRNKNIRVFHNPTSIDGFEDEARQIVAEQGLSTNLNWYDTSVFNEKAVGVIRDDRNTVVGYIVAGVSPKMIQDLTVESVLLIFLASLFGLFVGIGGAVFLARHVKATLFGLEPEDIATLLQERNALLNSVKEGVVAINKDAEITLINTESEFLFAQAGIPNPHTLLGKPLETVMNGLTLDTVLKEGRATLDMPVQVGSVLFIATLVPLFDNGHIGGAIITFRKKTELEELANQLTGVRNYADALRAQTHEFMNKMHVIMGLIDMKAYDELKQFTMEIANNRQAEAAYVVTRLKDITLAGFILGKISRARELDIEFSLTDESELTTEFIRPTVQELILIIGNLIENAFDVLRDHPSERIVNLSILTFDNEIMVMVEDSGPGIPENKLETIFEKGYSSKGPRRGIGLFLIKQTVTHLKGTIEVESTVGEGTTFTIRLPIVRTVKHMIKVLVVEDDPMVGKLHEHYLTQIKGFQLCDIVRNSDEALKIMQTKEYNLVILDIFMPGMDGLQLLAKIREQEYDVDVIIVSAANDKDKIKAALRLGAFDYIIKPFEFERFNLALNNYKSRYNLVEEQSILKQDELDKTIIHQDTDVEVTLPKGLDNNTLNTVWSEIIKIDGMFTTEEISAKVGISRVSIRKYLEFLKSLKLLSLDLHRGSVGRPVYKYKCIDKNANIIDLYIQ